MGTTTIKVQTALTGLLILAFTQSRLTLRNITFQGHTCIASRFIHISRNVCSFMLRNDWRRSANKTPLLHKVSWTAFWASAAWQFKSSFNMSASLDAFASVCTIPPIHTLHLAIWHFTKSHTSFSMEYRKSATLLKRFKTSSLLLSLWKSSFNYAICAECFTRSVQALSATTSISAALHLAHTFDAFVLENFSNSAKPASRFFAPSLKQSARCTSSASSPHFAAKASHFPAGRN